MSQDRREFQRLRLAKPILALFDGQNALILDIGISGAFVEHYGQPAKGDRLRLLFRWKGVDTEFIAEIAHTIVVRRTANAIVSHSGVRFVQSIGDAESRLNDMMATLVGKMLAAQKANAGATEGAESATLVDLGGARRARTPGFITYRLDGNQWSREMVETPTQPLNGFTVAAYEDESELESLCRAWETADAEGRRLIRLVAELSARTVKK
ncbi:MAG TPA: PilZ domain-containing protein [Thermoanaerobaculia bacterium]|nr:PilZ domain-containing protein [Thermoanaerobaculia bacterium]